MPTQGWRKSHKPGRPLMGIVASMYSAGMRSVQPIPGNPWPHDMSITIENHANALLELLWVREAYALDPVGDVPPLLMHPPDFAGGSTGATEWQAAWPVLWEACLAHAGHTRDPRLFEKLNATANASQERAELLRAMIGPSWRERFGDAAFNDSYSTWEQAWHDNLLGELTQPVESTPEHRALDGLIPAWKAGLAKIITIPCVGDYTRTVGDSALLVTGDTRQDPGRYAAALASYGGS